MQVQTQYEETKSEKIPDIDLKIDKTQEKKVVLKPPNKNDNPKPKRNKNKQAGAKSVIETSVKSKKITEMFQRVSKKLEPETLSNDKNQPEYKNTREKEPDLSISNQDTNCALQSSNLNLFKTKNNPDLEQLKVTKKTFLPELVIGPDKSED